MAKQTINIGAAANDGTGDPIRDAFDKVNQNFTELYNGTSKTLTVIVQDPTSTSALTTGDGKAMVPIDATLNGKNLIACSARLLNASSAGIPTFQLRRLRGATPADMLTTKLTIDATEKTSTTAAAPAVIDAANDDVATDDFIFIDVDVAGTGAYGLSVTLTFG